MPACDYCGKEVTMPYSCGYCGGSFCSEHRLPENHECEGLEEISKKSRKEGRIYRGVSEGLKREPEEREAPSLSREAISRIGGEPEPERREKRYGEGPPGLFGGMFRLLKGFLFRRATLMFLLIMVLVYIGQLAAQGILGGSYYTKGTYGTFLYYLAPSRNTALTKPWTLVTTIFVHGKFFHLLVNGIVLFFIGSALERRIGRNRFIYLFLGAGIIAAIAQILVTAPAIVVLGASGAILGALGALTVLAPRMPILLFFIIPMPLWVLTVGYGALSAIFAFSGAGGPIGHMAHFSGLVVGLACGYKFRRERKRRRHPLQQLLDRYHW